MEVIARLDRVDEHLADLAAAQGRTEHVLTQLAEAQLRTEQRVEQLAAGLERLAAAQTRTEEELRTVTRWRTGETGRRLGERYERAVIARATNLFVGGEGGGMGSETVRRRLGPAVSSHYDDVTLLRDESRDPFLADLIWWKGDHYAVVEISLVVDEHDVQRAHNRAQTLRHCGLDAIPVVIGDEWNDDEALGLANVLRLAWKVGDDLSERYIAFRRLPTSS